MQPDYLGEQDHYYYNLNFLTSLLIINKLNLQTETICTGGKMSNQAITRPSSLLPPPPPQIMKGIVDQSAH